MSDHHDSCSTLHRTSSDSLSEKIRESLRLEFNKPDFKQVDLRGSFMPNATSSISSSSDSLAEGKGQVRSDCHFGEIMASTAGLRSKLGHRRSMSAGVPLYFSGRSFGNVSGASRSGSGSSPASETHAPGPTLTAATPTTLMPAVLGLGTANYGHGSIMRGGSRVISSLTYRDGDWSGMEMRNADEFVFKKAMSSCDPEEVKKGGNEMYRKGNYVDALSLYDRSISLSPRVASYRSNRAAALAALGRLGDAVRECKEALRLDSGYLRAHQRLASLYLRLGLVENVRYHIGFPGQLPDPNELQKLYSVEKHLSQCEDARYIGDWKSALREADACIAAGADSSIQLIACRAEAHLKLQQLDDAQSIIYAIQKYEAHSSLVLHIKCFGILVEAYVLYVKAQVEMAFGRFEAAIYLAEEASRIDCNSDELETFVKKLKIVASARSHGNDLFNLGKFAEACTAYGDGLKHVQTSSVLYCNRAICWSKLGLWEKSVEDCNHALKIQPRYTKALLRRAASFLKLERWTEALKDYEILQRELPDDKEVAEALSYTQAAAKSHQRELATSADVKVGEIQKVASHQHFKTARSSSSICR